MSEQDRMGLGAMQQWQHRVMQGTAGSGRTGAAVHSIAC